MAKDTENQEDIQFPLNKELLKESAKIKEERRVIRDRLKKIDSSRTEVSGSVFDKVRADYMAQLNDNTNILLEKKQDIDKELAVLYDAKKKVEENVGAHKEKLEELNFRFKLGEFKEQSFNKIAEEENEKLGKFEKILSAIEGNIKEYESLFEDEEEFATGSHHEASFSITEAEESERSASSENDYNIAPEGDYFGANTDEVAVDGDRNTEEVFPEQTSKDIPVQTPSAKHRMPTVTITEGEGTGDVYPVAKEELSIGRASSNDIVIKEAKVSRQHAVIKKQGAEFLIEDLHSSNGVYINGEKVKEHALSDGDEIKIGDFVLKFAC